MSSVDEVKRYLVTETGLATVSTVQADGRVLSSIVNCGVIDHPLTGTPCVALVSRGSAARIGHIRRGSQMTVAIRRDWNWISVTGPADLIGPDDLPPSFGTASVDTASFGTEQLRLLLREIYQAAGGSHDDYEAYDRAMVEDGRIAVLVAPDRILGNAAQ